MKPLSERLQKELAENAYMLRAWRAHREQRDEVLAGPHGPKFERLLAILDALILESAPLLLAYIRGVDWSSVDRSTRSVFLHETNNAITKMRERAGMPPIDDPLPGEPRDNVFRTIRAIVTTRIPVATGGIAGTFSKRPTIGV